MIKSNESWENYVLTKANKAGPVEHDGRQHELNVLVNRFGEIRIPKKLQRKCLKIRDRLKAIDIIKRIRIHVTAKDKCGDLKYAVPSDLTHILNKIIIAGSIKTSGQEIVQILGAVEVFLDEGLTTPGIHL